MSKEIESSCFAVTGAAGFLGWNLCSYLLERGATVLGLDNFLTGQPLNVENLQARFPKNFFFTTQDIVNGTGEWDSLVERNGLSKPRYVFHLASPASPTDFDRLWRETTMANTLGLLNVCDWAQTYAARVIFASTSEVYGNPLAHPQAEAFHGNVNFHGPRGCYDEAKRLGEALIYQMTRKGSPHGVVRIFNTFGPGMSFQDGRVISSFLRQAIETDRLIVHGDGSQTRSFCYVRDMVQGILQYALSGVSDPVNLGSYEEVSILNLAERVRKLVGRFSTQIEFRARRSDDPDRRRPDLSIAQSLLGWSPEVNLDAGLEATAKYFCDSIGVEGAS